MVRPGYKWVIKKKNSKLQVIELCAGIGQTSLALRKACKRLGIEMIIDAFCERDTCIGLCDVSSNTNIILV